MNTLKKIKGFTIIEVVLVLAIAGLIFLMVFIALPALQTGQRDSARKNDVGIVASAVNSYISAQRGKFPPAATSTPGTTGAVSGTPTIGGFVSNVSGNTTSIVVRATGTAGTPVTAADGIITVVPGVKCGGTTSTQQALAAGTARNYVVVTKLEGGGGTYYCVEN